jgi:hypothetical protein
MSTQVALAEFNDLFGSTTKTIGQNKVEYFNFVTGPCKTIRSLGFEGCFGIVIAGTQACIVAHVSPSPDAVAAVKDDIDNYYTSYPGTLFPAKVYIYAQVKLQSQTEVMYSELYNDLVHFLKDLTDRTPMLEKYIDPTDACFDQNNKPIPGTSREKSAFGRLVIKSGESRFSEPTIQFITIGMQLLEVRE